MTERYVYGIYPTYSEAELQADNIIANGVPKSAISIVANNDQEINTASAYEYIKLEQLEDNRSWFDKLFGIGYEESANDIDFKQYEDSLRDGNVLLVVDSAYEGQLVNLNADQHSGINNLYNKEINETDTYRKDFDNNQEIDSENIRLHEERVNVDTVRRDKGDVEITKEVVTETQTVEVPVEREEIHIKHKKPTSDHIADPNAFNEEEIVVPLSEEEVVVNKDTVVTDEVEISKTSHTDYETVSEETRREKLNIENDDNLEFKEKNDKDLF